MTVMEAGQPARLLAMLLAVIAVLALPGTDGSLTSYARDERVIGRGRLLASTGCARHGRDYVSDKRRQVQCQALTSDVQQPIDIGAMCLQEHHSDAQASRGATDGGSRKGEAASGCDSVGGQSFSAACDRAGQGPPPTMRRKILSMWSELTSLVLPLTS